MTRCYLPAALPGAPVCPVGRRDAGAPRVYGRAGC